MGKESLEAPTFLIPLLLGRSVCRPWSSPAWLPSGSSSTGLQCLLLMSQWTQVLSSKSQGPVLGRKRTHCHLSASTEANLGVRSCPCYPDHTYTSLGIMLCVRSTQEARTKGLVCPVAGSLSGSVKRMLIPVNTECYEHAYLKKHRSLQWLISKRSVTDFQWGFQ